MSHTNEKRLYLFQSHPTHIERTTVDSRNFRIHPSVPSIAKFGSTSTHYLHSHFYLYKIKEQSKMKATDITCKVTEHDILFGRGGGWVNVVGCSIVFDPNWRSKENSFVLICVPFLTIRVSSFPEPIFIQAIRDTEKLWMIINWNTANLKGPEKWRSRKRFSKKWNQVSF